jgi:hypothetical protein
LPNGVGSEGYPSEQDCSRVVHASITAPSLIKWTIEIQTMQFIRHQATYFLCCLMLFAGVAPSHADSVLPAQQSDCEIRANQFKSQHPDADPDYFMQSGFLYFGGTVPPHPPTTYRDAESGITFYVESDGRHVAAVDANGKLLWVRNPFVDRNMCPYRLAHPYIASIGDFGSPNADANALIVKEMNSEIARGAKFDRPNDGDRFIGLRFNTSQSGFIDIRNGYFYVGPQN